MDFIPADWYNYSTAGVVAVQKTKGKIMREFFERIEAVVSSGRDAVLVTIAASRGSTPRGVGARMLVTGSGRIAGSVGGGAVEFECEKLAAKCLENKCGARQHFSLERNEADDIGMICGGEVDVEFRYIPAGAESFGKLMEEIDEPSDAGRVIIFGGGHVSQQLVPLLARCDFDCVVVEDRPEFTKPELFGNRASDIRLIDMDSVVGPVLGITEDDYICIMTRGHMNDYLVLSRMLKTPACYIGVIGSRHKIASVNAKLKEDGYTDDDIQRITSPIGIDIQSETPAEIAVSIAAQLIEVRAKRRNNGINHRQRILQGN